MLGQAIGDHRIAYLEYEGPISNDRGQVARWDEGTYTLLTRTEDELAVELVGARMACVVTMQRDATQLEQWKFSFETV
jgi:hypothetical protein